MKYQKQKGVEEQIVWLAYILTLYSPSLKEARAETQAG